MRSLASSALDMGGKRAAADVRPLAVSRCSRHLNLRRTQSAGVPFGRHPTAEREHARRRPITNYVDSARPQAPAARGAIALPLEYHKLLGLNPDSMVKDSIINSAYDDFVQAPVEPGYSAMLVKQRAEMLDLVRSELILRRKSRTPAAEGSQVNVPADLIPGALALMNEVGEYEACLSVGYQLLEADDAVPASGRYDVLLALALANCGFASQVLAANPEQVVLGCNLLEDALELLEMAASEGSTPLVGGAAKLKADIQASLQPLKANCALKQLSTLPRGELRAKALASLGQLLSVPSAGVGSKVPGGAVSAAYADETLRLLDSSELAGLLDWEAVARNQRSYGWCSAELLYEVAVASMTTGYVRRTPRHVKTASALLKQLGQDADVLATRAVCDVMLGCTESAVRLLQQAENAVMLTPRGGSGSATSSSSSATADAGVLRTSQDALRFVKARSPANGEGEDGLLPGLCVYTEAWLTQVALPTFRDTTPGGDAASSPPAVSLVSYFNDPQVEAFLADYKEPNEAAARLVARIRHTLSKVQVLPAAQAAAAKLATPLQAAVSGRAGVAPQLLRSAMGVAVVGAVAAGGLALVRANAARSGAASVGVLPVATTAVAVAQPSAAVRLSARSAESLVRRWEAAKSAALGPQHDGSGLASVLAEPCLGEFRAKVAGFKQQGWHMRYATRSASIASVDTAAFTTTGTVRVIALLDETASLMSTTDGSKVDSYSGKYTAAYTLVRAPGGAADEWRISRIDLLDANGKAPSA